ncbi:MAG: hypothetical protein NZ889_02820, partial [Candidatus Pacearchaeota archaeon]|nr:hypothetical protein [Candidatus Pacearchaeota archaeon]
MIKIFIVFYVSKKMGKYTIAKKGMSELVSYVLLVVMSIALASGVYFWAKSKVPVGQEECPEGLSLSIIGCKFDTSNTPQLNLTLLNTGNFNISGIFVYITFDDNSVINLTSLPEDLSQTEDFFPILEERNYSSLVFFPQGKSYLHVTYIEVIPFKNLRKGTVLCDKIKY